MSTPDVTTHNQIVRPERYQPITTDDNVLDRLARLERALYRAGQLIDAQIARGSSEAYLTVPYAGPTTLLSLSYTPAVDCWWFPGTGSPDW